ncbi:hypothetical protein V2J09_018144 [Rumex salicifolius]
MWITWIISHKSNGSPSTWRCSNGVSVRRVNKIEVGWIRSWVEVSKSLTNNIKMVAVKMHWVLLNPKDTCSLVNAVAEFVSLKAGSGGSEDLGSISSNHCHHVVAYCKEELLIKCRVDYSQKNRLTSMFVLVVLGTVSHTRVHLPMVFAFDGSHAWILSVHCHDIHSLAQPLHWCLLNLSIVKTNVKPSLNGSPVRVPLSPIQTSLQQASGSREVFTISTQSLPPYS